jgi:regulator of sigma E protease
MSIVIIFILVLGALIFVHELGHFLMARRSGMKVEEFGFGFPPRLGGFVWSEEKKRHVFVAGNKEVSSSHTVYSVNWIPFGGFVRIKGENGDGAHDPDSFASKGAIPRIKTLSAGVVMNFLFAWFLISIVLMLGFPRAIEENEKIDPSKVEVQIAQVLPGTPAADMGLKMGDVILSVSGEKFLRVERVQEIIQTKKGQEIAFQIRRGEETLTLKGMPRVEYPKTEGALGIALGEITLARYGFFEAVLQGAVSTWNNTVMIVVGIGKLLASLFTADSAGLSDVSGPLGIAYLTKEVSNLGFVYLLYFTAILSINLAVLNILPFPALDGGRIFFILIEKMKGSPVSERVEGYFHQAGFLLLILLMIAVTVHDFAKFDIVQKIRNLF